MPAFHQAVHANDLSNERRFRFASSCTERACPQWPGSQCHAIESVISANPQMEPSTTAAILRHSKLLPWFAQSGRRACRVCPLVVTDLAEAVA